MIKLRSFNTVYCYLSVKAMQCCSGTLWINYNSYNRVFPPIMHELDIFYLYFMAGIGVSFEIKNCTEECPDGTFPHDEWSTWSECREPGDKCTRTRDCGNDQFLCQHFSLICLLYVIFQKKNSYRHLLATRPFKGYINENYNY